jgi:hypothetical protein
MKDEKGRPMTYWGGLEPTDPYEKGFIDGMAKQRDSRVQQMVEGYAQMRELTDEEIEGVYQSLQLEDYITKQDCVDFARAILRKAQEK